MIEQWEDAVWRILQEVNRIYSRCEEEDLPPEFKDLRYIRTLIEDVLEEHESSD